MHTLHFVAVNLDGEFTEGNAEETIGDLLDRDSWFDYFTVGGRWDGFFAAPENGLSRRANNLMSGNVLPVVEYPELALQVLDQVTARQDEEFRRARNYITGAKVAVSDIPGHVFGLPVAPSEDAANRMSAEHARTAAEWAQVLKSDALAQAASLGQGVPVVWHVQRLLKLLEYEWHPDSGFVDVTENSSRSYRASDPHGLRKAIQENSTSLGDVALVVCDLHY